MKFFDEYGEEIKAYDANGVQINTREALKQNIGNSVDIKALIDTGISMADLKQVDGSNVFFQIVPEGCTIEKMDLSKQIEDIEDRRKVRELGRPLRNTGQVNAADVKSFVNLVSREVIPETTVCMADVKEKCFHAIINYAEDGLIAGHCDRLINLELEHTLEFKRWIKNDRQRLTQLQLADFLEENIENITEPEGAEMVQMISNLKVKRNAVYESTIDTETGEQSIMYKEDISGEMQKGQMNFKSKFKIAVTVFYGGLPYSIECNLRFSIDSQKLLVYFSMINIEKIKEHAFEAEAKIVEEDMEQLGIPVYHVR